MNMKCIVMAITLVTCLGISGCGSSGGNGAGVGSCSSMAGCTDYVGSNWTEQSAQEGCNQVPGSAYSSDPCPAKDLVGSCSINQGGPGEFINRYYAPMFDAATAQTACIASAGTWIP